MTTPNDLNAQFAQPGLNFIEGPGGLIFAEIDTPLASARICLQGAHLTTWQPRGQNAPVVWVSQDAQYAAGKSIRGGVPVCWPWFGPHAAESAFPAHGFARTVPWAVTHTATRADGALEITLRLIDSDLTRAQWPHPTRLELTLSIGATLGCALATTNLGEADLVIGEALHTYLRIGDIADIRITGLEGVEFIDKVDASARKRQDGPITCAGEVDRVYLNTASACVIEDARLQRRLIIEKTGSNSTVVWTPWADKAAKMGDLGPVTDNLGGWREMVCVESANAADNLVTVAPGSTHTLNVTYRAEAS